MQQSDTSVRVYPINTSPVGCCSIGTVFAKRFQTMVKFYSNSPTQNYATMNILSHRASCFGGRQLVVQTT